MTLKTTPDMSITDIGVEDDIPKICYNILIYIYMKNILTNQEKQLFQKNCVNVVANIKQSLPDDAIKDEISEFILSLIHMRSLHVPTIQKYNEEAVKNLLLTFDKSLNENEALEKAKDLLTFNNFINDKSNVKNIQEVLVLNSRNDEFMNESKMNLFDKLLKEFSLFNNYLYINTDKIDIAKGRSLENFLNVKEEIFCSNYFHLCQKFYEQSIIYYRLKIIFENLIEYVDTNSKIFKKDKLLDLLNLEYKINKPSKIHTNYVLGDEILFPKLKLTDIYNYEKVIVEVKSDDYNHDTPTYEKGSEKIVDGRFLVTVKNLRKEINDEHSYADLMKTVKNYVLAITIIDKDIANMVRELDYEDMEKCEISQMNLIDYYSPLVLSEAHCQEKMQTLFISLRDDHEQNRVDIPDKIKTSYYQCKLNYYRNHLTDAAHIIQPSDFLEGRVYVLKQPYYLISNIDNTYKKKNIRLFLTENTLDYLLLDNIQIPECLGRCTIQHFNKVVLVNSNTKKDDIVIYNGLVPENTVSKKRKEMIVYVNDAYIHNLRKDNITNEEITRKDFLEGNVRVCLGMGTYFKKHFLTEDHFNLKHIPVYDFTNEHNFKIFLRKNKTMVSKNPNDICFVNYKLSLTNIEINDPYREISEDLIKNLYILKNK
ncbi:high molecular weight rhoptry protein 2, putative [Plasmodium ovale]|uniref:High molecular weight rhoptry protein 2, putative n=1 Tax=Plasmodium ovale TaxID=36330 RepID=A0A1C3KQV9_PLAOA|nr:high molecular weight rhoptry protein 2, putative [Plasmodium ovale]